MTGLSRYGSMADHRTRLSLYRARDYRLPHNPSAVPLVPRSVGTTARIASACSDEFSVGVKDILSQSRQPEITRVRFALYYVTKKITRLSMAAIGRRLDRDHTSILNGLRRAEWMIAKDPIYAAGIERVIRTVIADCVKDGGGVAA